MKNKYPIEAFALAMVVFATNMKEAILTGILIIFLTIVGMLIKDLLEKHVPKWSLNSCIVILSLAIDYALVHSIMNGYLNMNLDSITMMIHGAIALLIAKHIITCDNFDYVRHLFEGAVAYGILIIISLIREFIAVGQIYGIQVAEFDFMSKGFQNVAIGLIFAGIAIVIINRVFNYASDQYSAIYVAIPVLLKEQPFLVRSIPESVSIAIAFVVSIILLLSIISYLKFSPIDKKWRSLPVELVSLSIVYLSLIAI